MMGFPKRPIAIATLLATVCAVPCFADEADEASPNSAATETKAADAKPSKAVVEVTAKKNQRFSDSAGKAGLCDIYSPDGDAPEGGFPVVLVVHGGAWISGDKWTLEGYSRLLASHGIVAVTMNYRLAPAHPFPAQADDVREALLWIVDHAGDLSVNVEKLGLFGYSAGGHLSALIAALADEPIEIQAAASNWNEEDVRWAKLPGIRAICVGGPPCDFREVPIDNRAFSFFLGGSRRERPDLYVAASPTAHVSADDPVTQIIHGETDVMVPIEGSRAFHAAQQMAGVDTRFKLMPKQGHMVTFLNPKTRQTMLAFFKEVL